MSAEKIEAMEKFFQSTIAGGAVDDESARGQAMQAPDAGDEPSKRDELDQMLDSLASDSNMVVDGTTEEERGITAEDIAGMAKEIMTDEEFDNRILTERAINKFERQRKEAQEKADKEYAFLKWYYKYQMDQYAQKYGHRMPGRESRKLRRKIERDWNDGKLRKLYESSLN